VVHNLVPLCHLCHDRMPSCKHRAAAISWVNSVKTAPTLWNVFTHNLLWGKTPQRSTTLLRARLEYSERTRVVDLAVRCGADVDKIIAELRAGVPPRDIGDELAHRLGA
jgi:hypothetical protein